MRAVGSEPVLGILLKLTTLFIALIFLVLFQGCAEDDISLRRFPYPYRAGLALSSDIDGTDSVAEFLTIQEYLCTRRDTRWGTGLGLEVGGSFWFYDFSGLSNFTVFDSSGAVDSVAARVINDFIRSGYIDCLHTYGDFNSKEYQFETWMAEKAARYFEQNDLSVPAWVNHGNFNNTQCLGRQPYERGDNPSTPEYHSFLLKDFGIRYIETWNVTHRVSMDRTAGIKDAAWGVYEFLFSLKEWVRTGRPDLMTNSRLLDQFTLDDGLNFWRFRRFINDDGDVSQYGVDVEYLADQIEAKNLDKLFEAGGYQIIYTHFGANDRFDDYLPEVTRDKLEMLAERFDDGEILITTTTRLLDYNLMTRLIDWRYEEEDGEYRIEVEALQDPLNPEAEYAVSRLMGLTFYTPSPEKTSLYYQGEKVTDLQINPPDYTGRSSVGIRWEWLQYPEGY